MRKIIRPLLLLPLVVPIITNATVVWSGCQTIVAISTEPNQASLLITLSPGISGCSAQGVTGAINFTIGQEGLAATDLSNILGTSVSAYALGRQVMLAYDNATTNCYGTAVSIGGYQAQCP